MASRRREPERDRERLHGRRFISWERAGGVQTPSCAGFGVRAVQATMTEEQT